LSLVTFQGTESEHIANELIAKTREKCISASELAESSPNPPSAPRLQCSAATIFGRALRNSRFACRNHCMRINFIATFVALALAMASYSAFGLSRSLPQPEILFPIGYDTNRAEQVHSVLRAERFKYLGGLVSYWEPEWATTLVYEGDAQSLSAFLAALNEVQGVTVRLTFSSDLAKETGRALLAGSGWVMYSHTQPNTITVRVNLAAEALGREKFELRLPKR
jgi:hypothetical protein